MSDTLESIDPALAQLQAYAKISRGTSAAIHKMRQQAIFSDGAVPARLKALAAMLWAVSARCEPCLKYYAREAKRLGATEQELGDFLAVAATMGGCVGEMWAVKAYAGWHDGEEAASCCST